ncbi:Protein bimA [Grifola frondosa]|uniref:Protein bimA n=1 Tax=Grifola frondosa TaxID=5627 RepID=A0A1C7MDW7_GRIFR|nr:Protein bimA [Grifola frondosa]
MTHGIYMLRRFSNLGSHTPHIGSLTFRQTRDGDIGRLERRWRSASVTRHIHLLNRWGHVQRDPFPKKLSYIVGQGHCYQRKSPRPSRSQLSRCFETNPMLWEAFEGLCSLGDAQYTPGLYQLQQPDLINPQPFRVEPMAGPRDSIGTTDSSFNLDASYIQPIRASRSQPTNSLTVQPPARTAPPSTTAADTNLIKPSKSVGTLLSGPGVGDRSKSSKTAATSSRSLALHPPGKAAREQASLGLGAATRRSTRLQSGIGTKLHPATKHAAVRRRTHARTRSNTMESDMDEEPVEVAPTFSPSPPPIPRSPPLESSPQPPIWTVAQEQQAQDAYDKELADYHIYDLMRSFARAARAMALYDCQACLEELENCLHSTSDRPGSWAWSEGLIMSSDSILRPSAHSKPFRNVKLSFLAQELLSTDPHSPQAWIAVGNCFSLQKEKTQALTCFRRAAQLDPTCAYAYTLSGHESIDEDLDKAINFFESALRADPRHYNAWYGLGTCYMRKSRLRLADYHYRKASQIHPQNAVLLGCVAMVSERYGLPEKALELFDKAVRLSPENALVRYHRAKILISLKRYALAVQDLEYLRDSSPEESNVIFQLAKVYRLLGDEVKSAQLLAVARDVSPKSVNKIRKLLETVKDAGAADEVMDEG